MSTIIAICGKNKNGCPQIYKKGYPGYHKNTVKLILKAIRSHMTGQNTLCLRFVEVNFISFLQEMKSLLDSNILHFWNEQVECPVVHCV